MAKDEALMSLACAAELFHTSISMVKGMIKDGELEARKVPGNGRLVWVTLPSLKKHIEEMTRKCRTEERADDRCASSE